MPFIVDSWTAENGPGKGPPDNEIISMVQTHDGYLWLGTLHGLVRFDGIHFTLFDVMNTPGLPSDRIVYLFEDRQTNLWVGTEPAGLCAIRNGVVEKFDLDDVAGKIIYADEDAAGTVLFCTENGKIFCVHNGKVNPPPATFSAQSFYYAAFHLRASGTNAVTWELQNGQIEKLRDGRHEKDCGASPWPTRPVFTLFHSGGSFIPIQFDADVTAVCRDRDGNLIVGTLGEGVFWYEPDGTYQRVGTKQGLSSDYVLSLCLDREGNLWVGTDGGGLDRIKKNSLRRPG